MDQSLISRVRQAEVDLLEALTGDENDMGRIADGWNSLQAKIQKGVQSGSLDESAMQAILVIANRVFIVSKDYLQYQIEAEALASGFMSQLEQAFSNITLGDSSPTTSRSSSTSTLYIEPSYNWLLRNLHNPYPSKKTKESIAHQTGCPAKDVDNWFVEARRKIGWNALRRSHFNNRRQSIIEAASRFFGKSGDAPSLTPDLETVFANIQLQAENLYRRKLSEQPSLLKCDGHIDDRYEPSRPSKRRCTPSQSSSTTATSSSLCRSDSSDGSPSDDDFRLTDNTSSDADRSASTASFLSSCSSPALYTDCLNDESFASSYPLPDSRNYAPAASSLKRKRQLSSDDSFDTLKRPRTSCSSLPLVDISDPPPLSSSSSSSSPESLFDGTDLPPSLEIELFNPSDLFGSENDARFLEPANQTVVASTHCSLAQSQRKTDAASDLSYDPFVSVVDNQIFGDQTLPSNGLPYLDITLDGLPEPLDWLTPFLDEATLDRLLEPNPLLQLDFPPIDDVLALDFPLSLEVY